MDRSKSVVRVIRKVQSRSAIFLLDQVLACTKSATSEYSSQCLSALLGRPGRVKFVRGDRRRSALARSCHAPTGADQGHEDR